MKKNEILIEDKNKNISLFSDIIAPYKFSKYSHQLNKVFANYSNFFEELTKVEEKKHITLKEQINNWLNLSNYSKDMHIKKFDINEFKLKLKEMKLKEKLSKEQIKKIKDKRNIKRKLISQLTANKVLKIKIKNKKLYQPCLGVYNPSYDAIGKHNYQVTFEKQNFEDFNNNNKTNRDKNNNLMKKDGDNDMKFNTIYSTSRNKNKFINFEKSINRTHTQMKCYHIDKYSHLRKSINNSEYKINLDLNSKSLTQRNNDEKVTKKIFLSNNDDLLFSSQNKIKKRNKLRKEKFFLKTYHTFNSKPNLIRRESQKVRDKSPVFNLKGIIKFDKISKKKGCYFDELAKEKIGPPVGVYHPNYSTIYSRTKNIIFNIPKKENKKDIKRKFIHKIITNYNQTIQYETSNALNKKS